MSGREEDLWAAGDSTPSAFAAFPAVSRAVFLALSAVSRAVSLARPAVSKADSFALPAVSRAVSLACPAVSRAVVLACPAVSRAVSLACSAASLAFSAASPTIEPSIALAAREERLSGSFFEDFGCFVQLWPGCEGLVHVSQLDVKRVDKPSDLVKVGDEILVKSMGYDKKGRLNLSRKEVLKGSEEKKEETK